MTENTPVQPTPQTVPAPSNWLAIASMVCAIVGWLFTLTIIGAILWIPLMIIAFVLWVIVVVDKKAWKWMAIVGIVIPVIAWIVTLIGGYFIGRVVQDLALPIEEFAQELDQMIENDPELATLMEDEEFEKQVAELTEEKIKELMTDKFNGEDDSFNMGVITEVVELGLESYKESLNELKVEYLEEKTE